MNYKNQLLNRKRILEEQDYEAEELYDELLDDIYPEVKLNGCLYSHSRVLKDVDPIAYRVGLGDFVSAELQHIEEELEELEEEEDE